MTNLATTSCSTAQPRRDAVRQEVARGLSGADDGEMFWNRQTEALMFDNGRLKQAPMTPRRVLDSAPSRMTRSAMRIRRSVAAGADARRRRGAGGARRL